MSAIEIIFGILLIAMSLILIIIVLLQEGHDENIGVVTGVADTFLSKNKARDANSKLERLTKYIAIGFFASVIVINIIMFFTQS
jgi:preprotein translocase subunit SecG